MAELGTDGRGEVGRGQVPTTGATKVKGGSCADALPIDRDCAEKRGGAEAMWLVGSLRGFQKLGVKKLRGNVMFRSRIATIVYKYMHIYLWSAS